MQQEGKRIRRPFSGGFNDTRPKLSIELSHLSKICAVQGTDLRTRENGIGRECLDKRTGFVQCIPGLGARKHTPESDDGFG